MEKCRLCDLKFKCIASLITHIGSFHKNCNSYACVYKNCYRSYNNFNSLREHIRRKHIVSAEKPNVHCAVKDLHMRESEDKLESCENSNIEFIELPTVPDDECFDDGSDSDVSESFLPENYYLNCYSNSDIFIDDYLHSIGLCFISKLYQYNNLNRKIVLSIINDTKDVNKEVIDNIIKQTETLNISESEKIKLNNILMSSASFLDSFDSEHKCFSEFKKLKTFVEPVSIVVGQRTEFKNESLTKKMISVPIDIQIIPLRKVFKFFFELPNVFDDVEKYLQNLNARSEIVENFVQGDYWVNRKDQRGDKFVVAISLYSDDYQNNNPLGSHRGPCKTMANYINILSLPPQYSSKLENIFVFALLNTIDRQILGNEIVFSKMIEELRFLENEGITIDLPTKSIQIYFELVLTTGDNLGLHSILGFLESFNAHSFCHKCLIKKSQINNITSERNCILRNRSNYETQLSSKNSKETGIKQECVLHKLDNFHVTENVAVDPMHDILEGVARYDM